MAFFQVDDKFSSNHKVRAMVESEGYNKASQAIALWVLSGSLARLSGLDGVITLGNATSVTLDRTAARRGAALLVRYGLWHAEGHGCEACPQPPAGAWVFHQWFQFSYGTGAAERVKTAKGKELRTPEIVEAVWARDTDAHGVARCRYCGKRVHRPPRKHGGDRRSSSLGHLDHVDPTKAVGPSNIAVACAGCNQHKAQRTPEQAGLKLLPPPSRTGTDQDENQDEIKTGTNPAIKTKPSPEVSPPRARARAGAGGVGVGVRTGVEVEEGSAGAVPLATVAGRWGSPWKDHHGPPPPDDLVTAATCPTHDQPMPCASCHGEGYR